MHRNKSENRIYNNYEHYYNSNAINMVNDYYKKDFVLLGYKFDRHTKEIPLLNL